VAGFIGSPPMNLVPGRVEGQNFLLDGLSLPLPIPAPRQGELILGLRPEHASVAASGWPLKVELVEMLGAERLVHGLLGQQPFTLRIDGMAVATEMGSTLSLQASQLHWFDPATQQRVDAA
jgi:sn-glycerol 3-phosphate transport system ATP-binding protein